MERIFHAEEITCRDTLMIFTACSGNCYSFHMAVIQSIRGGVDLVRKGSRGHAIKGLYSMLRDLVFPESSGKPVKCLNKIIMWLDSCFNYSKSFASLYIFLNHLISLHRKRCWDFDWHWIESIDQWEGKSHLNTESSDPWIWYISIYLDFL